ncbi:sigma-54-dependent transcriptional regulator [Desulfovibrio inopinatus]|uniref:sigma-54-dependent transcriptional regulator n=1 Tax=Desulfovibrio inopinatus TaxID=102109 RepID=UPI0003FFE5BF|nr:sigma-54 dependent transcriptional regulator [Desulfovibrio inopinatus]
MARILIVDDDPVLCRQFELYMKKLGYESAAEQCVADGIALASQVDFDIVLLDIILPDANGLESITAFRSTPAMPEVIIITSESGPDSAEMAIRNGAWHYLGKPLAYNEVKLLIARALQFRESRGEVRKSVSRLRGQLLGNAPVFRECLERISKAAQSLGNVLITGETGTGKELISRAIHFNSKRADSSLVTVDCTNIPETLGESLLFGHERGAFTDAKERREGLIAQAKDGTLFLDEVEDLPLSLQRSLLRVIQEGRFRPLGSPREIINQCRYIAATNADVKAMVKNGTFRQDLYYRLAVFHIDVPPLRARIEDVPLLVEHYMKKVCREYNVPPKRISKECLDAFFSYTWPGNIRELVNIIQVSIANADDESVIYPHHLPLELKTYYFRKRFSSSVGLYDDQGIGLGRVEGQIPTLKQFRQEAYNQLEEKYLDNLLSRSAGQVRQACQLAGISRSRLYQLLTKYGRTMDL